MRLIANAPESTAGVKRMMIYKDESGAYLFGFSHLADGRCLFDKWHKTISDAKASACEGYKILLESWTQIDDPAEFCQHDWIQPVRVKGRNTGAPRWGELERFVDGKWEAFDSELQF